MNSPLQRPVIYSLLLHARAQLAAHNRRARSKEREEDRGPPRRRAPASADRTRSLDSTRQQEGICALQGGDGRQAWHTVQQAPLLAQLGEWRNMLASNSVCVQNAARARSAEDK
jgi:hypothetical protein